MAAVSNRPAGSPNRGVTSLPSVALREGWVPVARPPRGGGFPPTALIHVAYDEEKLRHLLKARGTTWEPALRRWHLPLPLVQELQLENPLDSPPPAS